MKIAALALLFAFAAPAAAADRNYAITGFDRIRVDGPYQVVLRTGVAPFAKASGSQAAIDAVAIRVEGRTLIVRAGGGNWGGYPGEKRGPVTIQLGTHELTSATLNGAGALVIDKARGLSFDLYVIGAGMARIDSVDVDQMKTGITGAGTMRLAGRVGKLTATARGSASLEAEALQVKDAAIVADGPALVRATVTETAKVDAFGLASVNFAGNPSCIVRIQGSASVNGCK